MLLKVSLCLCASVLLWHKGFLRWSGSMPQNYLFVLQVSVKGYPITSSSNIISSSKSMGVFIRWIDILLDSENQNKCVAQPWKMEHTVFQWFSVRNTIIFMKWWDREAYLFDLLVTWKNVDGGKKICGGEAV